MNSLNKDAMWTLNYPNLGTGPHPVEPYVSQRHFALVRDRVFKRVWLCTGKRVDEMPQPGDFLVEDIDFLGVSIVIVRGKDGAIRGLHNVCKHRGNKLTRNSRGSCRGGLVCGYHGWAYGLDGKLLGASEEDMFFDFNNRSHNLTPVAVDTWGGFIFINLDPNPRETLREYLGELTDLFDGYAFDQLPVAFSYTANLNCGWGVLRDSQLEGYHLKFLHKRTVPGTMVNNASSPSRHALDFKLFRRHAVGSYYGKRADGNTGPVGALAAKIGQTLGSAATAMSDVNQWPKGLNPTREPDWFFDICYIFPNFHIVFIGSHAFVAHTMWPKAVDKSSWNARGYFPPTNTLSERFSREFMKCGVRDLWLEDGSTLEGTQIGLESGIIQNMEIQDQEILIRHAEAVVHEMIAEPQATKGGGPELRVSK